MSSKPKQFETCGRDFTKSLGLVTEGPIQQQGLQRKWVQQDYGKSSQT